MDQKILDILKEVSSGKLAPEIANLQIEEIIKNRLFTFSIVRWNDNEHYDVVCLNKSIADEYVKKYNELSGSEQCFVDDEIWLPLDKI